MARLLRKKVSRRKIPIVMGSYVGLQPARCCASSRIDESHFNITSFVGSSATVSILPHVLQMFLVVILLSALPQHLLTSTIDAVHAHDLAVHNPTSFRRQSVAPKLVGEQATTVGSAAAALIHHNSMPFPIKVTLNETIALTLNNNTKLETSIRPSISSTSTLAKKPQQKRRAVSQQQQKQRTSRRQKRQRTAKPPSSSNNSVNLTNKATAATAAKTVKNVKPVTALQKSSATNVSARQQYNKRRHLTPSRSVTAMDNSKKSAALLAETPNTGAAHRVHKPNKPKYGHNRKWRPPVAAGGSSTTAAPIVVATTAAILRPRSSVVTLPSVHIAHSTAPRRNYHTYKPSEIRILQSADHTTRLLSDTSTTTSTQPPSVASPKRKSKRTRKRKNSSVGTPASPIESTRSAELVTVAHSPSPPKLYGTFNGGGVHGSSVITRKPAIIKDVDYVGAEFVPEPQYSQSHSVVTQNIINNMEPPLSSIAAASPPTPSNGDNFNVWEPSVTLATSATSTTEDPFQWTHSTRFSTTTVWQSTTSTTTTKSPWDPDPSADSMLLFGNADPMLDVPFPVTESTTNLSVESLQLTYKPGNLKTTTTTTPLPPPLDVSFHHTDSGDGKYFGVHNQQRGESTNKNNNTYFGGVTKTNSSGSKHNKKNLASKNEADTGRRPAKKGKGSESVFAPPTALEQQVSMARNAAQRVKSEMYNRFSTPMRGPPLPRPPHAPPLLESPALNVPPDDAPPPPEPTPPPRTHRYTPHHSPDPAHHHGHHRPRHHHEHQNAQFSNPPSATDPSHNNYNYSPGSPSQFPLESFFENGGVNVAAGGAYGPSSVDYGGPTVFNNGGNTAQPPPTAAQMPYFGDLQLLALSGILEEVLPIELPKAAAEAAAAAFGFDLNTGARTPPPLPPSRYYERNYWATPPPPHSSPSNTPETSPTLMLPLRSENNGNNNNHRPYQYGQRPNYSYPPHPPLDARSHGFANGHNRKHHEGGGMEEGRFTPPHWYP